MVRPYLAVTAAALLARTLWPPVLPALICLLGLRFGGTPGAKCGLLGGILALFLAGCMALGLVACGGGDSNPPAGVPSRFMRKFVCRLRLNEVSRQ